VTDAGKSLDARLRSPRRRASAQNVIESRQALARNLIVGCATLGYGDQ
jgi:hypothetical protein